MMLKYFKQQYIYPFIWCLYYLQGTLYAEGSIISQGLLAVFLLCSIYYFIQVCKYKNVPRPIKALKYLAIMFGFYGLLRLGVETSGWRYVNDATTYFKEYELSILPIFAFYYFSRERLIDSKWFYQFTFVFFVTAIASFMYQETQALLRTWRGETTNNAGYFVVSLMPLLVFYRKKPIIQYAALLLIFLLVIRGMKRGAILAVVIGGAYFVWSSFKKAHGKKKLLFLLMGLIAVIASVAFFQYQLANSDYMQLRMEMTKEGDMSNRESMYPAYFNYFFDKAGPLEFMFGFGADGTLKNMGEFAHQDWLETMMNQGILGLSLMLYFWISLFVTTWHSRLLKCPNITIIMSLFLIIYFIKSMISMSINGMTLFATSALAYALAGLYNPSIREELTD